MKKLWNSGYHSGYYSGYYSGYHSGYLRVVVMLLFALSAAISHPAQAFTGFDGDVGWRLVAPKPQVGQTERVTPQPTLPHQLYLPLLANGPAVTTTAAQLSTPQLLAQAVARGEITADERILYLAYALYEPASLPTQFYSNVGWYGTSYVAEVQEYTEQALAATTDAIRQELSRLSRLAMTVCDNEDGSNSADSTNFHFDYDTISGGLTLSDYTTSMETTFAIEVTQFGWAKPPLCTGGDTCGGETNPWGKYPIQIFDLGSGLYGYVTGGGLYTGYIGDNPNTTATETAAIATCMVLNDNFSLFSEGAQAALDATTSHEFVHAIQYAYGDAGTDEDDMWYESSAAYMEDEIFDDANSDYLYLWPEVSNCLGEWPNNSAPYGVSQYSNFLFFRHVAEHNGGVGIAGGGEDVMQHFWENVGAGQAQLIAYNNALVAEGTNLADAFHDYAIAAKFSKACGAGYAAPYCFEEGADYASSVGELPAVQDSIAAIPGSSTGSVQNNYAINWVTLPTNSTYQVTLHNTAAGGQLRGSLVCDTGSTFKIAPFAALVGAGESTTIGAFDATGCTDVVAVISNQEQTAGNPTSCTAHGYTVEISPLTTQNSSVTQQSVNTSYNATPQTCPAVGDNLALHTITPTLRNTSASAFDNLVFRVKELAYTTAQGGNQPSLCNATTVVDQGRVDSTLSVDNSALPGSDSQFNPTDDLVTNFQIGLPVRARYRLFVDLYSATATGAATSDSQQAAGEYLGSFTFVVDPATGEVTMTP